MRVSDEKREERERRTAVLTRGSKQKREEGKNRLHMKHTQRKLDKLKERLEKWDDIEEALLLKKEEEERRQKEKEELDPPKKKGRKGPESWKLKGAARPAHLVYDFDTRYVDPHMKAHEEAKKKASRCRNIFVLCKGRFGIENDKDVPQPHCREYLSLLMQLGNLSMHSKQLKTARKSFLECMELDSSESPITPARCQLMRLYMEANRPDSARRLWEKLSPTDPSVWIRYSAVLIEYVSFNLLEEEGSSEQNCIDRMVEAIKSNIFCAYYIAFFDDFYQVMEYVDEIEDAHESSPLEEAIEYCNSEQLGAWKGTEGAMEWAKRFLLRLVNDESTHGRYGISASDLDWRKAISDTREMHPSSSSVDSDDESVVDVEMYSNMFETAMEMLEDSGALKSKI
ncbi:unnamed protein product [Pseudo-nitzschia multistriata]|uniref:Uncharacterized protein n=1 Tax=Pseudo-nitzschia multistriata TaxID=183589 RepID=A0A448YUV8_9STRA|nr:unnamed protein product [Pseudo-nitzschia multistriata]